MHVQHYHSPYVVLKPWTFPAGLYGGNSITVFVEKGVPLPEGNPGHSEVYDFNTMICYGPGCPGEPMFRRYPISKKSNRKKETDNWKRVETE